MDCEDCGGSIGGMGLDGCVCGLCGTLEINPAAVEQLCEIMDRPEELRAFIAGFNLDFDLGT